MAGEADNWYRVALFASGACVISALAVLSGPKGTHRVPTRELGQHQSGSAHAMAMSRA